MCLRRAKAGLAAACLAWEDAAEKIAAAVTAAVGVQTQLFQSSAEAALIRCSGRLLHRLP